MDQLLCAILVYLPVEGYTGYKGISEFYMYAQKFTECEKESAMVPTAYEVLELAQNGMRYKDLKICNWVNARTTETQFGAATFRIGANTTVSYKGTDYSLIGWIENFRLAYEYPTRTHKLAIEYLKNNVKFLGDKYLYVTGHSKGGNLAMVSAMETTDRIWSKIQKVYNFDGPGFRKDEFEGSRYEKLSSKLVNVLPSGSIIGVLLYNKGYTTVKSNKYAVEEHNPVSWTLFGEFFVENKLSGISNRIHEATTKGIEDLDYQTTKEALEAVFDSFEQDVTKDVGMSLEDLIKFVRNMKNVNPEVRKSIEKIFEELLSFNFVEEGKAKIKRFPWRRS